MHGTFLTTIIYDQEWDLCSHTFLNYKQEQDNLDNCFFRNTGKITFFSSFFSSRKMKYYIFIILFVCTSIKSAEIELNDRKLYRVVPESEGDLEFLKTIRDLEPGLIFWNGFGETEEPVDILASPSTLDQVFREAPSSLRKALTTKYPEVEIEFNQDDEKEDEQDALILPTPTLIPQQDIPETNLKTGTYYKIGLKRFPNGYLRTTPDQNSTTDSQSYIIIDTAASTNPKYQNAGSHYDQIQWYFVPSNVSGWYVLRNRFTDNSKAYTTWSRNWPTDEETKYVYLVTQSRSQEQSDNLAEDNDNFLWKPIPTPEAGKFRLRVKDYPNDFVTWTEQKYGATSHYLQVEYSPDARHRAIYDQGNDWWDDTLFTFEPIETSVQAIVKQIELDTKSFIDDGLMPLYMKTDCDHDSSKNLTFNNRGSVEDVQSLQQKSKLQGTFMLRLNDDLLKNALDFKNAKMTVPWSTNYNVIESQNQDGENFSLNTKEKVKFSTDVVIPPFTKRILQTCYQHIELSLSDQSGIPIQAVVEAFCATDRPSVEFKSVSSRGNTECVDKELRDRNEVPGVELGRRQTSVVLSLYGTIVSGKFGHQGIFVPLLS
ncbi:unnamed protein product [Orchesella dallaii]|uniref:Uncharacterized protein n=1 Tax=Orchesella dallaii TaxID=48710 RepID=A0ABP1QAY0_9HEXA